MTYYYFQFIVSLCGFIVPTILYIIGRIERDDGLKIFAFLTFVAWVIWVITMATMYARSFSGG